MELKGLTQDDLARKCDVSQAAIFKVLSGQTKNPRFIGELSDALGKSVKYLKSGIDDIQYSQQPVHQTGMSDAPLKPKSSKIPVWGVVDAQDGEKYAVNTEDTPIDYVDPLPSIAADKGAFCLLISGESMMPAVKPGHIAYIDTRKPPLKGELCVVQLKDGGAFIKNYLGKNDKEVRLEQLNPHKEIVIKMSDVERILFVAGALFR